MKYSGEYERIVLAWLTDISVIAYRRVYRANDVCRLVARSLINSRLTPFINSRGKLYTLTLRRHELRYSGNHDDEATIRNIEQTTFVA